MEIRNLEKNKTFRYFEIDEANDINYNINKEIHEKNYRRIRPLLGIELNSH